MRIPGLPRLTWAEQKAINKEYFGFESFEGILCDISIKGCKKRIADLEKCYQSNFIARELAEERKKLAEWEERAKSPAAY